MGETEGGNLLEQLKAVADESRLSILRHLSASELSVGDLAQKVNLGEPTVSHHLTRLREVGLVTLRMAGNQRFYRVNETGLEKFKGQVAQIERFPPDEETEEQDSGWMTALGWGDEDLHVLRELVRGKRLTHVPTKQKKLLVVLRWLATLFEPDRLYSEGEINSILKQAYSEDFVGLRRDLVDFGYLRRERGGGKYWLAPAGADEASARVDG